MYNMISTRNGVDIINVTSLTEASELLSSLYENTSLSKTEIAKVVAFSGLSVSDTVKCYNSFIREEGRVRKNEIFRPCAA